jgi:cytochrome c biogenesis protein CcmG/thiol:disulfide interchange protein DsbE
VTIHLPRPLALRSAAVVAVLVTAAVVGVRASSSSPQPPSVSVQPTAWQLPRLAGSGDLRMADLRGHPVVLDFFASWCTACRGELPGMAALSEQLRGRVTFAGVDSLENGDGLAMARQYGVDWWPLARDAGGIQDSGLHDALGARGMPLTVFYDRSGQVRAVVFGALTEDDLRSRIQSLYGIAA